MKTKHVQVLTFVVVAFSFLGYFKWRVDLLTENQNLLMNCLSVKSRHLSRAKGREEMDSLGYVRFTRTNHPDRDYYLEKNGPSHYLTISGAEGYIEYRDDVSVDAGVETVTKAL